MKTSGRRAQSDGQSLPPQQSERVQALGAGQHCCGAGQDVVDNFLGRIEFQFGGRPIRVQASSEHPIKYTLTWYRDSRNRLQGTLLLAYQMVRTRPKSGSECEYSVANVFCGNVFRPEHPEADMNVNYFDINGRPRH